MINSASPTKATIKKNNVSNIDAFRLTNSSEINNIANNISRKIKQYSITSKNDHSHRGSFKSKDTLTFDE